MRELDRCRGLHAVLREAEVDDACERRQGVADAERVERRQTALRVGDEGRVLRVQAVVEQDAAAEVLSLVRVRIRPRQDLRGRDVEPAGARERDLAEACEREDVGDRERLREDGAHAFVPLEIAQGRHGQGDGRRRDGRAVIRAGDSNTARDRRQLGHAAELAHLRRHAHAVTRVHRRAAEDEDALGGRRIGVRVRVLLLHVEAAELTRALEVADDDALDGDRLADLGDVSVVPWTSWMNVVLAGAAVEKENVRSAAIWSGGSIVSVSLTPSAKTVTEQVSPCAKSVSGLIV